MHRALLVLAVSTALAAPASAGGFSATSSFSAVAAFSSPGPGNRGAWVARPVGRHDGSGDHRRHIHVGDDNLAYGYGNYGNDLDGDGSFGADRGNGWWHDRPDRAYSRWMSRNQDCARTWYSGDVLTC